MYVPAKRTLTRGGPSNTLALLRPARDFSAVYDEHVWRVYGFFAYRMRTRAESAVVAALAQAMQNKVDETFTGTLQQLAARSERRRAASS